VLAAMLLSRGEYGGVRILREETWKLMTTPHEVPTARPEGAKPAGKRGLGWDMQSGFSSNRGRSFSPAAFGHGGFTGTSFWIDPDRDLFVIFLSNRLHPAGKGAVNSLAGQIGTFAGEAIK
jgi:CubicO group peptidase (beta-lactamase class C family)